MSKSWVVRIRNPKLIDAYKLVMSAEHVEFAKEIIGIEDATKQDVNEYICASGLQLMMKQIKELKVMQKHAARKSDMKAITDDVVRQSLIDALRESGFEFVASEVEKGGGGE